jgi:hypothetical protein
MAKNAFCFWRERGGAVSVCKMARFIALLLKFENRAQYVQRPEFFPSEPTD